MSVESSTRASAEGFAADSLGGHPYVLQSDLARLCLPTAFQDSNRKLAWANSICFVFLVIGLIGLKAPGVFFPPLSAMVEVVPIEFIPPPPQEVHTDTPAPEEQTTSPELAPVEQPKLMRVVSAETPAEFVVPISGPVLLVPAPRYASPPPREPPKPIVKAAPTVVRFQPGTDGGRYPPPPYLTTFQLARQQGRVLVYITVAPSGDVTSCEVKESSGYGALDRHVAQWVKNHWQFPPGEHPQYAWECIFQLK